MNNKCSPNYKTINNNASPFFIAKNFNVNYMLIEANEFCDKFLFE